MRAPWVDVEEQEVVDCSAVRFSSFSWSSCDLLSKLPHSHFLSVTDLRLMLFAWQSYHCRFHSHNARHGDPPRSVLRLAGGGGPRGPSARSCWLTCRLPSLPSRLDPGLRFDPRPLRWSVPRTLCSPGRGCAVVLPPRNTGVCLVPARRLAARPSLALRCVGLALGQAHRSALVGLAELWKPSKVSTFSFG